MSSNPARPIHIARRVVEPRVDADWRGYFDAACGERDYARGVCVTTHAPMVSCPECLERLRRLRDKESR